MKQIRTSTVGLLILLALAIPGCNDAVTPDSEWATTTSVAPRSEDDRPNYTTKEGLAYLTGLPDDEANLNLALCRLVWNQAQPEIHDAKTDGPLGIDLSKSPDFRLDAFADEHPAVRWIRLADGHRNQLDLLSRLKELQAVSLRKVNLTGIDLGVLASIPKLAWLDLSGSAISPDQASQLAACKQLRVLYLNGKETRDATIEALIGLPDMHFISLRFAKISDRTMELLSQEWTNLGAIDIYECPELSLRSVEYLKRMKQLKYANIGWLPGRDRLMNDRLQAIEAALPDCQVLAGS